MSTKMLCEYRTKSTLLLPTMFQNMRNRQKMSKMQSQTAQRHLFVLIDNKHACRSPNQTKRHDSDNLHGGWIAGWGWESANVTLALCAAIESTQDFYEQFLFFFPFFFLLMLLLSQMCVSSRKSRNRKTKSIGFRIIFTKVTFFAIVPISVCE